MNIPWNWYLISSHPNLTWNIIQNNPNIIWHWGCLSCHKNITWEIIKNNPDKDWNWSNISINPNITWEIIDNNPDKAWDYYQIFNNKMNKGKTRWIDNLRLKIIKALQIQRHWGNCSKNPEYLLAQKLIR